jgi:hypothetical protein
MVEFQSYIILGIFIELELADFSMAFIEVWCSQKEFIAGDNFLGIFQILGIVINRGIGLRQYIQ